MNYLTKPNTIHETEGKEIAESHGLTFDEVQADFNQANQYGKIALTRADSRGNGLGMYPDAKQLFIGYLRDIAHESAADAVAYRKYEDMAFGPMD